MTGTRLVIGIGNELRRDDGFGPAVVRLLRDDQRLPAAGVRLVVSDGEPATLLDLWTESERVVLVEAVRGSFPVGRWFELRPDDLATGPTVSSHGVSLLDTVELARTLDRLPRTLVVLAAAGADFSHGTVLSPALAAAVAPVASRAASLALA